MVLSGNNGMHTLMEFNVCIVGVVHWMSSDIFVGCLVVVWCYYDLDLIINCIVRLLLSELMLKPALTSFFSAIMSIAIDGMKLNYVDIF